MAPASTNSACLSGVEGLLVHVECDISIGNFYFGIVGLPESEVKESRERVNSAITNTVGSFPIGKVIVNLSPADIRKNGTGFDLPMALSVLAASGSFATDTLQQFLFVAELSLSGELRPVPGILSMAALAAKQGIPYLVVAPENAYEASFIKEIRVFSAESLKQILSSFHSRFELKEHPYHTPTEDGRRSAVDLSEVRGQQKAKRALEIAAAGAHNVLFRGPPGSGKSMLAKSVPSILPPMTEREIIEVTKIYSVSGLLNGSKVIHVHRPYRSPHHSISNAGLIGGGKYPKPGEISLAHKGVLFLDEFPEFPRNILDLMRQPLEDKKLIISRAGVSVEFPADFMLVAAMNDCPCGYYGDVSKRCICSAAQIQKYRSKISGPMFDRFDIQVELPNIGYREMNFQKKGETSAIIKSRVMDARKIQQKRFQSPEGVNSAMTRQDITLYCQLSKEGHTIMESAMKQMGFSNRAHDRILKICRTIADLEGAPDIVPSHIIEAVNYRMADSSQHT